MFEEQQQQQYEQPGQYETVNNKDGDFLKWFLDNKKSIESLKYLWQGYYLDNNGMWQSDKNSDSKRMMNDLGIHECVQFMETFLSKVFHSTNFDAEQMNWTMRENVTRPVWNVLYKRYREYSSSKNKMYMVCKQIVATIHAMLLGARGSGIRDMVTKTHNVTEVKQTNGDNRGFNNWVGGIFGMKKGGDIDGQ